LIALSTFSVTTRLLNGLPFLRLLSMYHSHALIVLVLNRPFLFFFTPFLIIYRFPSTLDVIEVLLGVIVDLGIH
jgi:hypothetical protein